MVFELVECFIATEDVKKPGVNMVKTLNVLLDRKLTFQP